VSKMGLLLLLVLVHSLQESSQSSFVVGIAFRFDASVSPFCAGTLVAERWVVTSASCVSSDRHVFHFSKLPSSLFFNVTTSPWLGPRTPKDKDCPHFGAGLIHALPISYTRPRPALGWLGHWWILLQKNFTQD